MAQEGSKRAVFQRSTYYYYYYDYYYHLLLLLLGRGPNTTLLCSYTEATPATFRCSLSRCGTSSVPEVHPPS